MECDANKITAEKMHLESVLLQLTDKSKELDDAIAVIKHDNEDNAVSRQITEYEQTINKNFSNIAAEDALDNIINAQKRLETMRRQNASIKHEMEMQQREIDSRAKHLQTLTSEAEKLIRHTGWKEGNTPVNAESRNLKLAELREMAIEEENIRKTLKSAHGIIEKKAQTILALNTTIEEQKDKINVLNSLYNDIRLQERDNAEIEVRCVSLQNEQEPLNRALAKVDEINVLMSNSVTALEKDNGQLTTSVKEHKILCNNQNAIKKAQLARQDQLQRRLNIVEQSMKDMKLMDEYIRTSKSSPSKRNSSASKRDSINSVNSRALIESTPYAEPKSISEIFCENEQIPIDTYRLLYDDKELLKQTVSRKEMLVLEKEGILMSETAKLGKEIRAFNKIIKQNEQLRANESAEKEEFENELLDKEKRLQEEVKNLREEYMLLRNKLNQKTAVTPVLPQCNDQAEISIVAETDEHTSIHEYPHIHAQNSNNNNSNSNSTQ